MLIFVQPGNGCYEMTFFNWKSQRTFTCQIVQNAKRHLEGAKTMQISGIGHSVIRGLVTTGQWFSASTTVYPRGSPQGRRHSYFVDCWTFINRLAPSGCRLAAQMYMDSLNTIHCVKICGSRTKPRSGAKHPWSTDFYAIRYQGIMHKKCYLSSSPRYNKPFLLPQQSLQCLPLISLQF